MSFDPDLQGAEYPRISASNPPEDGIGICEVVTVPPKDDVPYVFEISQGERLLFNVTASLAFDVVLCSETAYDDWVDAEFETHQPLEALLVLRDAKTHSFEFKPDHDVVLVAILFNFSDAALESIVLTNVRKSRS